MTICSATILALVVMPMSSSQAQQRGGFSLYARALMNEDRQPSVKVSTHLPHSNLVFLRKGDHFEAKYRVYVRVFDGSGKRMVDSAVLRKTVVVSGYEETRSHKNSSTLSRQFALSPGDYVVRSTARVANTHLVFSRETAVTVPDIMRSGIGVSKPRFFAAAVDTSRAGRVLRRIGQEERIYVEQKDHATFAALDGQPGLEFDLYLEDVLQDSIRCVLTYEVVGRDNSQVLYGRRTVRLMGAEDQFVVSFNVDEWSPGRYVFNIKASLAEPLRESVATLPFDVEFTRAMLSRHFDVTISILSLIASEDEIKRFEEASEADRAALWLLFWKGRDPTPRTEENETLEEHWRRVRYANENFATSEPGWRSDRGKIYIRYGEPDEIDVRSDPYVQGQYLIWRYYEDNLTFVFYDRFGLGEYILSNSSTF
ncbi:MAG: GWxTD domain-containing protein [Candidatus Krumholzibacteria bacterium]|nr:GWxTD domain-containing protein [Candidatus Krumholzibacteria bacterium]